MGSWIFLILLIVFWLAFMAFVFVYLIPTLVIKARKNKNQWERILEKGIVAIATIVIGLVGIVILFFRYRV